MKKNIYLKDVQEKDLDIFYEHQQDSDALFMAAFVSKEPSNRSAFDNHWHKIMNDPDIIIKTIYYKDKIIGNIAKYVSSGTPELTYWIGKEYWGRGLTTQALKLFLNEVKIRPIYARAARDNAGSIRVLEKCGFNLKNSTKGFANARHQEIEEVLMQLE